MKCVVSAGKDLDREKNNILGLALLAFKSMYFITSKVIVIATVQ